jgi:hypothetical protein
MMLAKFTSFHKVLPDERVYVCAVVISVFRGCYIKKGSHIAQYGSEVQSV